MEALARLTGTYVPIYQGLSAADLVRPARARRFELYFPFDRPDALPFYQRHGYELVGVMEGFPVPGERQHFLRKWLG